MPKRKAATARLSGLIGSDDEDVMQPGAVQDHDGRPTKKARGRPRSKSGEMKTPAQPKPEPVAATVEETEVTSGRGTRRGRPKGSRNSGQVAAQDATEKQNTPAREEQDAPTQETDGDDEISAPRPTTKPTRAAKGASTRGKKKSAAEKPVQTDGEFEYTPKNTRQQKKIEKPEEQPEPDGRKRRKSATGATQSTPEVEDTVQEVVEETFLGEEIPATQPVSVSSAKRRQSSIRASLGSPSKRKPGGDDDKLGSEPELRRRLGDLTKKYDTLENRYRNLKDIGVVEANANMEKLKKQCESMTTASNNLITSLKAELEAQRALGQKSRLLQKQLRERDAELAKLTSEAEQSTSQLTAAQNEVKALQTKLAAARNTAATLEQSALKVPGSAIKSSGANRANAAEAAQAAQLAQLKEDLYSDLTGLIIRDVKQRNEDTLYDCIQTGVNGTLHFKLAVPRVSSANFETAEFQYIPLLDENRDRELVATLPEYLTVDITFVRQQASKFYTRVIDALTKRRASQGD
ncbi:chromosome segregation protein Csm1/Pcs1-domain-containing protein [Aspergillus pseudoustus]|uniref:Chromosome segregation protein Csm1/Pcs1-domain-containing protein n=1 Tax=Aspergillus pseudoustus TaxID=1810923 RepID=A0ABR4JEI6_9EURO